MRKVLLSVILFGFCLIWTSLVYAEDYPIVVSVSEYKINPDKYDEITGPDIYFEIVLNETVIETSKPVRDTNFHSYGDMKAFGDFCQGIRKFSPDDNITIKFYDSDYDSSITKKFWDWIHRSLYKYIAYFNKQVELMSDEDSQYDDFDAHKAATDDPELKEAEDRMTENVIAINNKRNNKHEYEFIGSVIVDVGKVMEELESGNSPFAAGYLIENPDSKRNIGKINLVITLFEGYGASLKVKGY